MSVEELPLRVVVDRNYDNYCRVCGRHKLLGCEGVLTGRRLTVPHFERFDLFERAEPIFIEIDVAELKAFEAQRNRRAEFVLAEPKAGAEGGESQD